jgi:hypothetical protein
MFGIFKGNRARELINITNLFLIGILKINKRDEICIGCRQKGKNEYIFPYFSPFGK